MSKLNLFDTSHLIIVALCTLTIIFLPRFFIGTSEQTKRNFAIIIIVIMIINQAMDFYREGILDDWKLGLPLHLCDFSTFAAAAYLITKKRPFFVFAFFFGIAGAGMSILTPDTFYGFPYVGYIQNQIGHTVIILVVSYAIIVEKERPYLKDVHQVLFFASVLLVFMYLINYLLGPPANYWFLIEKPIGNNVTAFMRNEPFHIIDLYILAVIVCYLLYTPYLLKDRT